MSGESHCCSPMIFRAILPCRSMMYVSGIIDVPYSSEILLEGSRNVGKLTPNSFRNFAYASGSSSMLPPSTTPFREAMYCCKRTMEGASLTHGGHQVAQKFSTTTLPLKLESCSVLPAISAEKLSAVLPAMEASPCR